MNEKREKIVSFILSLRKAGIIESEILNAVETTSRYIFIDKENYLHSYKNIELYQMNKLIAAKPSDLLSLINLVIPKDLNRQNVLEIGTGSGWLTSILSHLFKRVYSIDCDEKKILRLKKIFKKYDYKNIYLRNSDGKKGWPEVSPFDAIIVDAVDALPPQELQNQLAKKAFLVMPTYINNIIKITVFSKQGIVKIAGNINATPLL